jgi:hypothetical protein
VEGRQTGDIMKRYIEEMQGLTAAELLVVVFTPLSGMALSAAFFFG